MTEAFIRRPTVSEVEDDFQQAHLDLGLEPGQVLQPIQEGLAALAFLRRSLGRHAKAVQTSARRDDWAETEEGTEAIAQELGMWPARPGEDWAMFRDRIRIALKEQGLA